MIRPMCLGLPLPRVCYDIANVSRVETEMSGQVLVLSVSSAGALTEEAFRTSLTKPTQHGTWHVACATLCGFCMNKDSLVFSIIAPNYISEMTFSCHGTGFLSPRGKLQSYHDMKSGQRLEGFRSYSNLSGALSAPGQAAERSVTDSLPPPEPPARSAVPCGWDSSLLSASPTTL